MQGEDIHIRERGYWGGGYGKEEWVAGAERRGNNLNC